MFCGNLRTVRLWLYVCNKYQTLQKSDLYAWVAIDKKKSSKYQKKILEDAQTLQFAQELPRNSQYYYEMP